MTVRPGCPELKHAIVLRRALASALSGNALALPYRDLDLVKVSAGEGSRLDRATLMTAATPIEAAALQTKSTSGPENREKEPCRFLSGVGEPMLHVHAQRGRIADVQDNRFLNRADLQLTSKDMKYLAGSPPGCGTGLPQGA